jgi:REP element-mobilizing transposase RayT
MASHVFHEIYLHINWHTKDDQPLLEGQLEKDVHDHVTQRCRATKGVHLHGIGGTGTHVHLALAIEPFVNVSTLIGELKGSYAHDINRAHGAKVLDWQRGYGVVSFGKNSLPWVLDYIGDQREHHAQGKAFERLERTAGAEGGGSDLDETA